MRSLFVQESLRGRQSPWKATGVRTDASPGWSSKEGGAAQPRPPREQGGRWTEEGTWRAHHHHADPVKGKEAGWGRDSGPSVGSWRTPTEPDQRRANDRWRTNPSPSQPGTSLLAGGLRGRSKVGWEWAHGWSPQPLNLGDESSRWALRRVQILLCVRLC